MSYSSLEQRLAQNYIDMLPSFVPDENAPVSVSEQEHFYLLIKDLFQLVFDEPLLFVTSLHEYTSEIYARLLGDSAFKKLENWMLAQGYKRFDIYNITSSDCNLSLSIANPKWSEEPPRGGFEYKIKHTGIAAQFDYYVRKPPVFGLCIPNGMKPYLEL